MIAQMSEYIDIGVNLTGSSFRDDLGQVIERATNAGVNKMIVTGTDVEHSRKAIELCDLYPGVLFSTAGVHPHHADEFDVQSIEDLRELSQKACVVAIGECGLDYNRNFSTQENQRHAFESQLELATEVGKPVFLHQRDAHEDFIGMMANMRPPLSNAVAHCFTGSAAEVADYLELGFSIGITGWICDERRGHDLQAAVRDLPLNRVMIETDARYLMPRDLPEKLPARRNDPVVLPHILQSLAGYMSCDLEALAQAVTLNSEQLFGLNS